MKILLAAINAKYIHSNPAIYSLAAYAGEYLSESEKKECEISLAEFTINHNVESILGEIYNRKPDVIGFSCYIWNWEYVQKLIVELNKVLPEVHIYLGGPETSYTSQEILKEFPFLKGIIIGEGEEAFLQLCKYYALQGSRLICGEKQFVAPLETESPSCGENNNFSNFENKTIKNGNDLLDLNKIPFLYKDIEAFENRIIYYESSRGCPYRCSYCLSSLDKTLRYRDFSLVKKELSFFLKHKVPQVKFIDRTFNASKAHARSIWSYITEHDNNITNFHFEISAGILENEDFEILKKMRPGLVQFEIGVQTTNHETLKEINRTENLIKLKENVSRLNQLNNIHLHLDLIAGLPLENYDSFKESFNNIYEMNPHQLQLGFLKVLKGSPIWTRSKKYGIIYRDYPPYEVLYTKWITYEELKILKSIEEMVEIYYNSGQFTYTISMLVKEFNSPFELYKNLADYYVKKGYDLQSPSRIFRYEILLNFAGEYIRERKEMYLELIKYDLYLREKLKSRPDFLPSMDDMKEYSKNFYIKEEMERRFLPDYKDYNSRQMAKMTHLETFTYSVWEKGECKNLPEERYVLFNYKTRNPITKDACTTII